jgi:hypothetical protein
LKEILEYYKETHNKAQEETVRIYNWQTRLTEYRRWKNNFNESIKEQEKLKNSKIENYTINELIQIIINLHNNLKENKDLLSESKEYEYKLLEEENKQLDKQNRELKQDIERILAKTSRCEIGKIIKHFYQNYYCEYKKEEYTLEEILEKTVDNAIKLVRDWMDKAGSAFKKKEQEKIDKLEKQIQQRKEEVKIKQMQYDLLNIKIMEEVRARIQIELEIEQKQAKLEIEQKQAKLEIITETNKLYSIFPVQKFQWQLQSMIDRYINTLTKIYQELKEVMQEENKYTQILKKEIKDNKQAALDLERKTRDLQRQLKWEGQKLKEKYKL